MLNIYCHRFSWNIIALIILVYENVSTEIPRIAEKHYKVYFCMCSESVSVLMCRKMFKADNVRINKSQDHHIKSNEQEAQFPSPEQVMVSSKC